MGKRNIASIFPPSKLKINLGLLVLVGSVEQEAVPLLFGLRVDRSEQRQQDLPTREAVLALVHNLFDSILVL